MKTYSRAANHDDRFEPNDTIATATDFGPIVGQRVETDLVMAPDNEDWYGFTLPAAGRPGDGVAIAFDHALGDLDLSLFRQGGIYRQFEWVGSSTGTDNREFISFADLAAGEYFVQIYEFQGAGNPNYTLSLSTLSPAQPDRFELNDDPNNGTYLGVVSGFLAEKGLSIHEPGDVDWFVFTTTDRGIGADHAEITFSHGEGNLDLRLFDVNANLVGSSASVDNNERISLEGLPGGTYFLEVHGPDGAVNRAMLEVGG
jgi:hypothetical protein